MSVVLPVTRIVPQASQAIQMELGPNGQTAGLIAALLAELMAIAGYQTESLTGPQYPGGWRIKLSRANDADQFAYQGDWIMASDVDYNDTDGWQVQTVSRAYVYGVSAGLPGTAVDFVNMFTANTPLVWTPAPGLTAESGLVATLNFLQPTSPNGPFSYVVNLTDVTANATTQITPDASVDGPNVTMTIPDLTEGHEYHATVTVSTQYPGVTETSEVTNTITAVSTVLMSVSEEMAAERRGLETPLPEMPPQPTPIPATTPLSEGLVAPPPITTVPLA
jgi:hypothetical protein